MNPAPFKTNDFFRDGCRFFEFWFPTNHGNTSLVVVENHTTSGASYILVSEDGVDSNFDDMKPTQADIDAFSSACESRVTKHHKGLNWLK